MGSMRESTKKEKDDFYHAYYDQNLVVDLGSEPAIIDVDPARVFEDVKWLVAQATLEGGKYFAVGRVFRNTLVTELTIYGERVKAKPRPRLGTFRVEATSKPYRTNLTHVSEVRTIGVGQVAELYTTWTSTLRHYMDYGTDNPLKVAWHAAYQRANPRVQIVCAAPTWEV